MQAVGMQLVPTHNPFHRLQPFEVDAMGLQFMGNSWLSALCAEFGKDYFVQLSKFVTGKRPPHGGGDVFPQRADVFSWTTPCAIKEVKVVILGQDPYPGEDNFVDESCPTCGAIDDGAYGMPQLEDDDSNDSEHEYDGGQSFPSFAHGLAFSVKDDCGVRPRKTLPHSLKVIFKELEGNYQGFKYPGHGDLTKWAEQGVVLLNTVLTVDKDSPLSHSGKGWETFTDAVIQRICELNNTGVVFLLWGNSAIKKIENLIRKGGIEEARHRFLESSHPSAPRPGNKPFRRSKHFLRTNILLESLGKDHINWQN